MNRPTSPSTTLFMSTSIIVIISTIVFNLLVSFLPASSKVLAAGLCGAGRCSLSCGAQVCTDCPPGWYCAASFVSSAIRCPNGTSTDGRRRRVNASDCIPCAEGSFAENEGTGTCTQCSETDNYRGRPGVTGAKSFEEACEEVKSGAPPLSPVLRKYGNLEPINENSGSIEHAKLNRHETELLACLFANQESAVMIYRTLPLVLDRQRRNSENYQCSWYEPASSSTTESPFPALVLCIIFPHQQQSKFRALYAASMAFFGDDDNAGLVSYDTNQAPPSANVLEVRNEYVFLANQSAELLIRVNLNVALTDTTSTDGTNDDGVARAVVSINPDPILSNIIVEANRACVCDFRPSPNCYLFSRLGFLSKFVTNDQNVPEFSTRLDLSEAVGSEFATSSYATLIYDSVNDLIYTVAVTTIVKISPMIPSFRILSTLFAADWATNRLPRTIRFFEHGFLGERNEYLVVAVSFENPNLPISVLPIYVLDRNGTMKAPGAQSQAAYEEGVVSFRHRINSAFFLNSLNNNKRITQYATSSSSSSSPSSSSSSTFPPSPSVVTSASSFSGGVFMGIFSQHYQTIRTGKFVEGCNEGHTSRTVNHSEILGNNQLVVAKPGVNCSLTISNISAHSVVVNTFVDSSATLENITCSHGNSPWCILFDGSDEKIESLTVQNIFFSLAVGINEVETPPGNMYPLAAVYCMMKTEYVNEIDFDNITSIFRRSAPIADSSSSHHENVASSYNYYSVHFETDDISLYVHGNISLNNIRIVNSEIESKSDVFIVALLVGWVGFTSVTPFSANISNIEISNTVSSSVNSSSTMNALRFGSNLRTNPRFEAGAIFITNISITRCSMHSLSLDFNANDNNNNLIVSSSPRVVRVIDVSRRPFVACSIDFRTQLVIRNIFVTDFNFSVVSTDSIECRCLFVTRFIRGGATVTVSGISMVRIYGEIVEPQRTTSSDIVGNAAGQATFTLCEFFQQIRLQEIGTVLISDLTISAITIKQRSKSTNNNNNIVPAKVLVRGLVLHEMIAVYRPEKNSVQSVFVVNVHLSQLNFEEIMTSDSELHIFLILLGNEGRGAFYSYLLVSISSLRTSTIFLPPALASFNCFGVTAPVLSRSNSQKKGTMAEITNSVMKFSAANSKYCTQDNCSLIKINSSSNHLLDDLFFINNNSISDEGRAVGGDVGDGQSTSLISASDVSARESDFASTAVFSLYGNYNNGAILAGTTNRPRFSLNASKWIFRCNKWDEQLVEDFIDIARESPNPPVEGQIVSVCDTKSLTFTLQPPTRTAILTKSSTPSSSISEKPTRSNTFSRTKSSTFSPPPTRTRSNSRTRTISTSVTPPPTRTQTFSRTRTISPTITPPPTRTMTFSRTRSVSSSLTPPPTSTRTNTSTPTLSRTISESDNTPSRSFGTVSDTEPTKSLTFHDDSIAGLDPAVLAATTATAQTITAVASVLGSAPITAMALSKSLASLQLLGCPQFTPEGKRWSEVDPGFSWTLLPTVKIDLFDKDDDDNSSPISGGYYRAAVVGFVGLSVLGCIGGLVAKSLPKKLPRTDDDDLVILQDDEYDERIIDGKPVSASSLSTRGGRFLNLAASVSFTFVGQFFSVAGVVLSSEGGGVIDIILGIAPFLFTLPILAVGFVKLRDAITPRKKIVYKQPIIEINSRANTETLRIDTITRKNVVPYYCVPSFIAPTLDSIMKKKKEAEDNKNKNENDKDYDKEDFNNIDEKEKTSMASFLRLKKVKYVLGLLKSPFGRFVFIGDLVWCVDPAYYKSTFQACKSDKERLAVVEGNLTITMSSLFFRSKGPMREAVEIAPGNNSKKKVKSKSKQEKNVANTTNTNVISASLRAKLSTYYVLLVTLSAIICSFLQGVSRGLDNEKTICRTSIGVNALVSVTMLLLILYLRPLIVPLRNILFTVLEVCGTIVSLAVFALTESYPDTFPKNVSSQIAAIQVLAVSSGTLVAMLLLVLKGFRLYLFSSAGLQVVDEEEFLKRKKMETEILFGSSDENNNDDEQQPSRKFIFLGENFNNYSRRNRNSGSNSEEMKTKNRFDTHQVVTNGEDMIDAPLLLPARHTRSRKNNTVTRSSSVNNVNNNKHSDNAINDESPVHSNSNKKKRRRMVRRAQTFNDDQHHQNNNDDVNNRRLTKENLDRLFKSDHLI